MAVGTLAAAHAGAGYRFPGVGPPARCGATRFQAGHGGHGEDRRDQNRRGGGARLKDFGPGGLVEAARTTAKTEDSLTQQRPVTLTRSTVASTFHCEQVRLRSRET